MKIAARPLVFLSFFICCLLRDLRKTDNTESWVLHTCSLKPQAGAIINLSIMYIKPWILDNITWQMAGWRLHRLYVVKISLDFFKNSNLSETYHYVHVVSNLVRHEWKITLCHCHRFLFVLLIGRWTTRGRAFSNMSLSEARLQERRSKGDCNWQWIISVTPWSNLVYLFIKGSCGVFL